MISERCHNIVLDLNLLAAAVSHAQERLDFSGEEMASLFECEKSTYYAIRSGAYAGRQTPRDARVSMSLFLRVVNALDLNPSRFFCSEVDAKKPVNKINYDDLKRGI